MSTFDPEAEIRPAGAYRLRVYSFMGEQSSHSKSNVALLRLLVKLQLIDSSQALVDPAKSEYGPVAHFARQNCYDEEDAVQIIAEHLKIPVTVIDRHSLPGILKAFEHPRVSTIQAERWKAMSAIPVEASDNYLVLAMANPLEHEVQSSLEFELGMQVRITIAQEGQILHVIRQRLNSGKLFDLEGIIGEEEEQASPEPAGSLMIQAGAQGGDAASPPVIRLVNRILADSVSAGASDIHLTPEKSGLAVRIRVDGIINQMQEVPANMRGAVVSRVKLLAGMDIAERRKPQDGRLRISTAIGPRDLRISTVPALHGENIVIRILSTDFGRVSLATLGMPAGIHEGVLRSLKGSSRVFLVSGPTGSGKTSSLYAALLHLADGHRNIITVEDPIEYRLDGISQIQVNPKINVTFAEGLRSILRQDPDIIMVGEIRDQETASIAMNAAQTGHLVLSSIHTNTAAAAVTRLRDLGVPAYLVASSVGSVLAQRLVRRLCPHCCIAEDRPGVAGWPGSALILENLRKSRGCSECRGMGYSGRIGLFSFLELSEGIREAVRREASEVELEALAAGEGFQSFISSGVELLNSGVTSLDELERVLGPLDEKSFAAGRANLSFMNDLSRDSGKPAPAQSRSAGLSRRRLLLVEDDEDMRGILAMILKGELFDVVEAANGHEALEKVYEDVPELVLCDLMMPKMSGLEFMERLKKDSRTSHIPVIILTAADSEENELELIHSGADDFISKASDTKLMLARIQRLLQRSG